MESLDLETMHAEVRSLIEGWCERCDFRLVYMFGRFYTHLGMTGHGDGLCDFLDTCEQAIRICVLPENEAQILRRLSGYMGSPDAPTKAVIIEPVLWGDYSKSRLDPREATVGLLNQLCARREISRLNELLCAWFTQDGSRSALFKLRDRIAKFGQGISENSDRFAREIVYVFDDVLKPGYKDF